MRNISLLSLLSFAIACGDKDVDDSGVADLDGDGFDADADCNDTDADIHPDADEICDGVDNNCSGEADESPVDGLTYFVDADGDGSGDSADEGAAHCEQPEGYVLSSDDCDDSSAEVNTDAREVCDTIDNDCDGLIDDDDGDVDIGTGSEFYKDVDGDGYGVDSGSTTTLACAVPEGFSETAGDCDDTNEDINPDTSWSQDADGDGYGNETVALVQCEQPEGFVFEVGDCDDAAEAINPDASEVCDGFDNDCDDLVDDDDDSVDVSTFSTWYVDDDGDGYGTEDSIIEQCAQPSGYALENNDCDDSLDTVNPGVSEQSGNGIDDNCDGTGITFPTGETDETTASVIVDGGLTGSFGLRTEWSDFDGDGSDELIVADSGGSNGGTLYIWYGANTSTTTADASFVGTAGDSAGYTMASGDFNGDGYGDILAGAYSANAAYLIYGSATAFAGAYNLADADVVLSGTGSFGSTVASLGDVDGDGTDDFAVGAYSATANYSSEGQGFLFFSSYGALSSTVSSNEATQIWSGNGSSNWLGYYPQGLNGAGDMDGDGTADYAVASDWTNYTSDGVRGGVYFTYGDVSLGSGSYTVDGDEDFEFIGTGSSWNYFGDTNVPLGDVTGDGYDDFFIGAKGDGTGYIIPGSASRYTGSNSTTSGAAFVVTGGEELGYSAAGGDVDGDGAVDLIVSDPSAYDSNYTTLGSTYGWFGPVTGGTVSVADGKYGVHITNSTSEDSLSGEWIDIGDANGDGIGDLAIGAPGDGSTVNSEAWIFYGGDGSL